MSDHATAHPSEPAFPDEASPQTLVKLQRRVHHLEWFLKLAFDLNRTIDRQESIQAIRQFFKNIVQVDGFSLWLVSATSKKIELVTSFGVSATRYLVRRASSHPASSPSPGSAANEHHPLIERPPDSTHREDGSVLLLPLSPEAGTILGYIGLFRQNPSAFPEKEIALLQQAGRFIAMHLRKITLFQTTRELAYVDSLTRILNRRYFDQRFLKEIGRAQRYEREMSLLMIDIDHFKKYNDYLGHIAGDNALRQVAVMLEKKLRKADVVCRYGGEEFVVILPEIGAEAAGKVAEKLRKAVLLFDFPGEDKLPSGKLTISIGVAAFPQNGKNAADVLLHADQALYQAKESGRNQVIVAA